MSKQPKLDRNRVIIEDTVEQIRSAFGDKAAITFGRDLPRSIERISTGSFGLDWATGGGLPRGRITQLHGVESSGKSTVALHTCLSAIKAGGSALWGCTEDFDWGYAASVGLGDDTSFALAEAGEGNVLLDTLIDAIRSGRWDVIVLDSVADLRNWEYMVDKAGSIQRGVGELTRGGEAKMIGEFLARTMDSFRLLARRASSAAQTHAEIAALEARAAGASGKRGISAKETDRLERLKAEAASAPGHKLPAVILINQLRDGAVDGGGRPQTYTPGGRSLRHNKALDIEMRTVDKVWGGGAKKRADGSESDPSRSDDGTFRAMVAKRLAYRVVKSKVCPPFRYGAFMLGQADISPYAIGHIDRVAELLAFGLLTEVIEQAGSWYSFGATRLGQGEGKATQALRADAAMRDAVETAIRENLWKLTSTAGHDDHDGSSETPGDAGDLLAGLSDL